MPCLVIYPTQLSPIARIFCPHACSSCSRRRILHSTEICSCIAEKFTSSQFCFFEPESRSSFSPLSCVSWPKITKYVSVGWSPQETHQDGGTVPWGFCHSFRTRLLLRTVPIEGIPCVAALVSDFDNVTNLRPSGLSSANTNRHVQEFCHTYKKN